MANSFEALHVDPKMFKDTTPFTDEGQKLTLSWLNLSYKVKFGGGYKYLVQDLSGIVRPGETLAIMGPSGAGKTSLMNLLANRIKSGVTEGEILVNGKARSKASYVAQENLFLEIFSVRESLEFAANLTMPSSSTKKEKEAKIDEVVKIMGLQSCENTMVGGGFYRGLSGGQMKRLGIAVTLLSGASILFLDEPTSKLDSAAAFNVVQTIQQLADQGKTVIFSIHQPSSELFASLDKLTIITMGQIVYFGEAKESLDYFSNLGFPCPKYTNPADHFISLVNPDFGHFPNIDKIISSYNDSKLVQRIESEHQELTEIPQALINKNRASFLTQFALLFERNGRNTVFNPKVFRARLFSNCLFGFLFSSLYSLTPRGEVPAFAITALFFTIMNQFGTQTLAALPFFLALRPIFVRERSNGMYSVLPFQLANFIATVPTLAIYSLAATSIFHTWLGLAGSYYWFWLTAFCLLLCTESVMHILSAVTPYYVVAYSIAALYIIFFTCTAGYLVPTNQLIYILQYSSYASFFVYSFQNFIYNEFKDTPKNYDVLISYSAEDVDMELNLLIMGGFVVVLQFIFFLLLFFFNTGKQ